MSELEELKLAYAECSRQRNELLNKLKSQAQPAQQEPVAITTGMALAFHRALTDGPINDAEAKEIKIGLEAAFAHITTPPASKPLTDEQIEKLREKTFSTGNPYCPVDSKSMRKAARAIEAAHGIKENT